MKLKKVLDDNYEKNGDIGFKIMDTYSRRVINLNHNKLSVHVDKKLLLEGEYTYLGSYDFNTELFLWSYNSFLMKKSKRNYKEKLDNFAKKLLDNPNKYEDVDIVETVYYYLTTEIVKIKHQKIYDLVKVMTYVLGGKGVISRENKTSNIQKYDFYRIDNITRNNVK